MINIVEKLDRDLSIYSNNDLIPYLNECNKYTANELSVISDLMKQNYFKVPSILINQAWGTEKVFYPFSTKLFKVIYNNLGDTSLQLHPIKNEYYISLSDETIVIDEVKEYKMEKFSTMNIPKNTIHSLRKGSKVFEEQDNNLFDNRETIRIFDSLNRRIDYPQDYLKYLLPQHKEKIEFNSSIESDYTLNGDKFVFLIEGEIIIEDRDKKILLNKKEELYFLDNSINIKEIKGKAKIINCKYYGVNGLWKDNLTII